MKNNQPEATLENLYKIFTVPETADSTLVKLDCEISENLQGFLQDRIITVKKDIAIVEKDFANSKIPETPKFVSDHTEDLLEKLVSHSVHTAAPGFIGHMTSALPYFMLPLSKIMIALNQNMVKIETSKAFTPLERQVLGMMHRLIYKQNDAYYEQRMHQSQYFLGIFCSGGTAANISALWIARNKTFAATNDFAGVQQAGLAASLAHYNYKGAAILISELGHYSFRKAADILGIGSQNLISIPVDSNFKIDTKALETTCIELQQNGIKILSIVGLAGSTETGSIDNLTQMAHIAKQQNCHFHVDAAWGGPTLFSKQHAHLLNGIELADSVTIDAHKQMYTPIGAGMVLFRNPTLPAAIEHHAEYVIRKGSKDLGAAALEGSRSGMALLVHAGLHIMARSGYELLINQGIAKAKTFAAMITAHEDFELTSEPQLNILTYRFNPAVIQNKLKTATATESIKLNEIINELTVSIQKTQRELGKTFVSRTRIKSPNYNRQPIAVFRVILANPLTTEDTLHEVLTEQHMIANNPPALKLLEEMKQSAE